MKNEVIKLGMTSSGQEALLDYSDTNVEYHLRETPDLIELVREALPNVELPDEAQVVVEYDMGRVVGTTNLVETNENDEIVYAKRIGRDTYSRFAKNRSPSDCRFIVMVFKKTDDAYYLWTAMCGRLLPKEAYDPDSKFNATHAMAYDDNLVQIDTVTKIKPVT